MLLTFKPNKFFDELEKRDNRGRQTYQNAFSRAKKKGLIKLGHDNVPRLTDKGMAKIRPFIAKKLGKDARLMIVFDIPEDERHKRRQLRLLLKELSFKQVQKSVWVSEFDHKQYLKAAIKEYKLVGHVKIFEAVEI